MRVSLTPVVALPMGEDRYFLWSADAGAALIPRLLAGAILDCVGFRTVDEHCRQAMIRGRVPPALLDPLRTTIAELADRGFLVDDEVPTADGARPTATSVRDVGLVTCNRPASAAASLESYVVNSARAGRRDRFIVCDDSHTAEVRRMNVGQAAALAVRYGQKVRYAGPLEKTLYARRLAAAADLPADTVRAALLDPFGVGFCRGANTNALILDTVGKPFFCFDDDSFCRPARRAGTPGSVLSSWSPITDLAVFEDEAALRREVVAEETCLLGEHERWLGATVPGDTRDLDLSRANPALLARTRRGPPLKVLVTWSGIYGDSGSEYLTHYLYLTGPPRARLLRTESAYRAAVTGRIAWKASDRPTLARNDLFQSVAFAADNREPLPPFMPWLRASDTLFGKLVLDCFPAGLIGSLPWSVHHAPSPPRAQPADDVWRRAGELRFAGLVDLCLVTIRPAVLGGSAVQITAAIGRRLGELATLEPRDLRALLYPALAHTLSRAIRRLEALLEEHGSEPAFWAADVQRTIESYERRMVSGDPLCVADLPAAGPGSRRLLRALGSVLQAWPAMRDAAARLRDQEIFLSRPLGGRP
jgi:hypothetical protein